MTDMKSAYERAMERVQQLGEASAEEKAKWKYLPQGETLAARYMKEKFDLNQEISHLDPLAQKYVISGAFQSFMSNIELPRNKEMKATTEAALEGIRSLKKDKNALDGVIGKIKYILNHYEQDGARQREQTYQALKQDFQARVQSALQRQMGTSLPVEVDVEHQPQFQQEWRAALTQMEAQYYKLLDDYKKELHRLFQS